MRDGGRPVRLKQPRKLKKARDRSAPGENAHDQTRAIAEGRGDASDDLVKLIEEMRAGSRDAAATFMTRYGSRIRRRIRGKLNPSMRRLFDSLDILSTIGRRLDSYVRSGKLEAASEAQLWALVVRMADNAVIEKSRIFRRLQKVEAEDSRFSQELLNRLRQAERSGHNGFEVELEKAMAQIRDETDKQILSFWLAGSPLTQIAHCVDLAPTAVRKRWQGIKLKLLQGLLVELDR